MEDYSMDEINDKKNIVILFVEKEETVLGKRLVNIKNIEILPLKFGYDLSLYSDEYIELTKGLFIFYHDENNPYQNECLKLKKFLQHYQRNATCMYISNDLSCDRLIKISKDLSIPVIRTESDLVKLINDY